MAPYTVRQLDLAIQGIDAVSDAEVNEMLALVLQSSEFHRLRGGLLDDFEHRDVALRMEKRLERYTTSTFIFGVLTGIALEQFHHLRA